MKKVIFADLNIKHRGDSEQTLSNVRRAVRMGYDAVVINIDIGNYSEANIQNDGQPSKKKKKNQHKINEIENQIIIPNPFLIDESKLDLSTFLQIGKRFRQFRKGDFVDLITLDGIDEDVGNISWLFKQKIIQSCINVGIYFEITYSRALQSSERRRQLFSYARKLMEITRGGNGIVLSSGADELITLRAPYDVGNLSTLFGLSPESGRKLISENTQDILLRAQTRKTIKGAIHATNISTKTSGELFNQLSKIEEFKAEMTEFK
ncbi:hypothetical protein Mgra_00001977 [Meloidogyne graminicola]|uniref:Uncharacterized protein n=1 Tax=Meloidogyne graminicola TaxID=189291 RepID=A0A8S9ZZQ4_9BILA|nr:hypothetical protein Mgra_00001977 [Meloidogyne graminicola]